MLLLAASSAFGWMAVRRQISRQQEQVVEKLARLGPDARYSGPYVIGLRFSSPSGLDDDLVNRLFEGSLADAVTHLLQTREVSPRELAELERLIQKHRKNA